MQNDVGVFLVPFLPRLELQAYRGDSCFRQLSDVNDATVRSDLNHKFTQFIVRVPSDSIM